MSMMMVALPMARPILFTTARVVFGTASTKVKFFVVSIESAASDGFM